MGSERIGTQRIVGEDGEAREVPLVKLHDKRVNWKREVEAGHVKRVVPGTPNDGTQIQGQRVFEGKRTINAQRVSAEESKQRNRPESIMRSVAESSEEGTRPARFPEGYDRKTNTFRPKHGAFIQGGWPEFDKDGKIIER